jgi:signal transduction histidine kinase
MTVSIPIIFLVFSLYELGLDDATDVYLKADVAYAKERLTQKKPLPESNQFRHFYLGKETLPNEFKTSINNPRYYPYYIWQANNVIYHGLGEPYEGKRLYVFHTFTADEDIPGIQLETVVLMLVSLVLLLMMVGAILIYQRIASAMQYLSDVSNHSKALHPIKAASEFSEVNAVADALKASMDKLNERNTHERYFIQSLSHELRTPMAIIQAAVEVLKKQLQRDKNVQLDKKLTTIFNANLKMQSLANNLLSLWGKHEQQDKTNVNLNSVIEECVEDLGQQYDVTNRFNLLLPAHPVTQASSVFAVQLVFVNLIKNAVIHGDAPIEIKLTASQFVISNGALDENTDSNDSVGMGLFIIEQGVKYLGWNMRVTGADVYRVEIKFE